MSPPELFDTLRVEDARVAARALLADAAAGDRAALTEPEVRSFARTFLSDCAERWKPAFGDRRVDDIGAKDVRSWFDGIAATRPASACWTLAAMSSSRPPSPPLPPCRWPTTGCG